MSAFLPTRRDFVHLSGIMVGGAWLTLNMEACREAARDAAEAIAERDGPRVLTTEEVATVAALADRILPPDGDAPGAAALGAGMFADRVCALHDAWLAGLRTVLKGLPDRVAAVRSETTAFMALSAEEQDQVLSTLENEDAGHFYVLRILAVGGVLSDPSRGGNRDKAGWAMVAFDDRHAWQPPFGYYDAQAAGDGATKGGEA